MVSVAFSLRFLYSAANGHGYGVFIGNILCLVPLASVFYAAWFAADFMVEWWELLLHSLKTALGKAGVIKLSHKDEMQSFSYKDCVGSVQYKLPLLFLCRRSRAPYAEKPRFDNGGMAGIVLKAAFQGGDTCFQLFCSSETVQCRGRTGGVVLLVHLEKG